MTRSRLHVALRGLAPAIVPLATLACMGCRQSVKSPAPSEGIRFIDRTRESGIAFRFAEPSRRPGTILDTIGHGCAFLDYDRDGRLDILLVGTPSALYRGDGRGRFTDVSAETGIGRVPGHLLGVAVGDADGDGFPDLYLSGYRTGHLLRNQAGKRFVPVASGIPAQPWGTTAAWADHDGDGKLDLYVGNYVRFDETTRALCRDGDVETSCPPGQYDGIPGRLYRNLGGFRFVDVTGPVGLAKSPGKTLGAAWEDFDGDGRPDLALANDEVPGALFRNRGGRFVDIGAEAGVAYSNVGRPHAGMGEDWGDHDNDGRPDLAVATFATELKPVYQQGDHGLFVDRSAELGLGHDTVPHVAFGLKWIDVDNDGWLDLLLSNGHTSDNVERTGKGGTYRSPTLCFRSERGKRMARVRGSDLDRPIVGRGLATGDYDNDGRVDALVVDNEGAPLLLHNETAASGHWIRVRLEGARGGAPLPGTRVRVRTGGAVVERRAHTDGSYLSASDDRVHFGLAGASAVEWIEVVWPGGRTTRVANPGIDRELVIREDR